MFNQVTGLNLSATDGLGKISQMPQTGHKEALGCSVMITTKNRVEDLTRTTHYLQKLNPPPEEVLITADGCTDGTVRFVKSNLPTARLFINVTSRGSVASRDNMLRKAVGGLVLSLDDDSYPEQVDCIPRLTDLFSTHPNLAVAHFPQHSEEYPESLARTDFGQPRFTGTFANSGACFRRSFYLQLPGFESQFFHMYEEPDYALQCTAAGLEVLYTPAITIRHHWSPRARSEMRTHLQHARNEIWSIVLRCPFPLVFFFVGAKAFSSLRYAASRGPSWIVREPVWWCGALKGLPRVFGRRAPVSCSTYWRWFHLEDPVRRHGLAGKLIFRRAQKSSEEAAQC